MILIIGAGPAGLAMSYQLQRWGLPHRVLEKHRVGWAWANHYDSLRLHTLKGVSALPGLPMPPDYPRFPSRQQVLAYLRAYAAHFALPVEEGVEVRAAHWQGGGWQLETSAGAIAGQSMVVATGIWSTPVYPHFPGEAQFGGPILHARDYRRPDPFLGQRVLVVGVGNTGAELAVELSEHGVETSLVVRDGATFVPYPRSALAMRAAAWALRTLPRPLTAPLLARMRPQFSHLGLPPHPAGPLDAYPVVGYELPEAVAAGRVRVVGPVARLERGAAWLEDGSRLPVEAIILATGYRPTIDFVRPYLTLDARGWPHLDGWRAVGDLPLYCVGFRYPATEGWLQSIGRVTQQAAAQIARR